MNKKIKFLFKLFVSLVLITYVILNVDLMGVYDLIIGADFFYYLLAVVVTFSSVCISTYKWNVLLRFQKIRMPFAKLLSFYFIGLFTNLFFPGYIGGDLVRSHMVSKHSKKTLGSYSSLIFDRFTGGFVLLGLSSIGGLFFYYRTGLFMLLIPVLLLFLFVIFLIFHDILISASKKISLFVFKIYRIRTFGVKISRLFKSLYAFKFDMHVVSYSLFLGLVFQILAVLVSFILALAIGENISLFVFLFLVPVTAIFRMLPITISGIGIQENLYVFFLGLYGVNINAAFALSILLLSIGLLHAFAGGVMYLLSK